MKKIIAFIFVLFLAVISSACINTYAVQELNKIAMKYINENNPKAAISRLEASIDLDPRIYESRYNLATCYMQVGRYKEAIDNLLVAQDIKPDEADTYYNLAVSYENLANEFIEDSDINEENTPNTQNTDKDYNDSLKKAVENYEIYIRKAPNTTDLSAIKEKILFLNNKTSKQSTNLSF